MSALVDGQLDPAAADVAWRHVLGCEACRDAVDRERWVKKRLAETSVQAPPADFLGSLTQLDASTVPASWAAVAEIERRGRTGRRAGVVALAGGSAAALVVGITALTGPQLSVGGGAGVTGTPGSPAAPTSHRSDTGQHRD